jgi:hypothetical protein
LKEALLFVNRIARPDSDLAALSHRDAKKQKNFDSLGRGRLTRAVTPAGVVAGRQQGVDAGLRRHDGVLVAGGGEAGLLRSARNDGKLAAGSAMARTELIKVFLVLFVHKKNCFSL